MHSELKQIIELVQSSNDPVQVVVERYFASVTWTTLKDEFSKMTETEKKRLFHKLTVLRNMSNAAKALREQTRGNKK
jgi:hypothetical protein